MSGSWHSSLAVALSRALVEAPLLREHLMELPIIPLKSGRWVSSRNHQICFASTTEEREIPRGLLIGEIDSHATEDPARKSLFQQLGAEAYSQKLVCGAIVREQQAANFDPAAIDVHDHIARVAFLFDAGWKNRGDQCLWVVTEDELIERSSEIYTQSTQQCSAKEVLSGRFSSSFNLLHADYYSDPSIDSAELNRWLIDNLGLAELPRLVTSLSPKLDLARDFRVLSKEDPIQLLLLLRDHWSHYSDFFLFSQNSTSMEEHAKSDHLRAALAGVEVPCSGGRTRPLGQTTLPSGDLICGATRIADFIEIPEPEDTRWTFLSHFSVVIDLGIEKVVQYLTRLKSTGASIEQISDVYLQLQAFAHKNANEIR